MSAKQKTSLTDNDVLAVIDLHNRFTGCRTRADLYNCLEHHFLPLIDCETIGFGWANPDVKITSMAGYVGVTKEFAEFLGRGTPHCKTLVKKVISNVRPVVACDVDVPRKTARKDLFPFIKNNDPKYKTDADYIVHDTESGRKMTTFMLGVDRFEVGLAIGVHRWLPNDNVFTLREVRIMELVRPILFQTIKTIVLSEELAKYKFYSELLADTPTGAAMVSKDMRVVFLNKAFHKLFPLEPGHKLSADLAMTVQKEMDKQSQNTADRFAEATFYKLPNDTLRLSVDRINKDEGGEYWLLRLKPADDPISKMYLLMQNKGLTAREMEICVLLKDGIDAKEIADRLFISIHTLRTHMRNIHGKMDVHSSAQLVAALNRGYESESKGS